jgi:hypothetical protein
VTRPSSPQALALAEKLKQGNAKMYGAFWCSHCFNQKQNFGVEASKLIEYVECDREGLDSQYSTCKAKKVYIRIKDNASILTLFLEGSRIPNVGNKRSALSRREISN